MPTGRRRVICRPSAAGVCGERACFEGSLAPSIVRSMREPLDAVERSREHVLVASCGHRRRRFVARAHRSRVAERRGNCARAGGGCDAVRRESARPRGTTAHSLVVLLPLRVAHHRCRRHRRRDAPPSSPSTTDGAVVVAAAPSRRRPHGRPASARRRRRIFAGPLLSFSERTSQLATRGAKMTRRRISRW